MVRDSLPLLSAARTARPRPDRLPEGRDRPPARPGRRCPGALSQLRLRHRRGAARLRRPALAPAHRRLRQARARPLCGADQLRAGLLGPHPGAAPRPQGPRPRPAARLRSGGGEVRPVQRGLRARPALRGRRGRRRRDPPRWTPAGRSRSRATSRRGWPWPVSAVAAALGDGRTASGHLGATLCAGSDCASGLVDLAAARDGAPHGRARPRGSAPAGQPLHAAPRAAGRGRRPRDPAPPARRPPRPRWRCGTRAGAPSTGRRPTSASSTRT